MKYSELRRNLYKLQASACARAIDFLERGDVPRLHPLHCQICKFIKTNQPHIPRTIDKCAIDETMDEYRCPSQVSCRRYCDAVADRNIPVLSEMHTAFSKLAELEE